MVESMNKVLRMQRQMHQELEREPTLDELAAKVDMPPSGCARSCASARTRCRSTRRWARRTTDSNLADFIEDLRPTPRRHGHRKMLGEAVDRGARRAHRARAGGRALRFGLDDGQARTLEEVGKEFGVTRERIRQIEAKTLAKLRQRAGVFHQLLHHETRPVVVDVGTLTEGTGSSMEALRQRFASDDVSLLVTRACYLGLRRASALATRPTGVVLVHEKGRSLDAFEVEQILGVDVRAEIRHHRSVARAVDTGKLARRCPKGLASDIGQLVQ
jgi:hypothetical protein